MSTNSSNLITEGDLLQIPLDKRTLAIVDVGPVCRISFSPPLSWANPFMLKVLALPRLKCDGISESPDKSGLFIPWMGAGLRSFHCSVFFLIYPFYLFIYFFLTKQISNKAAVADMQMLQGGIAASKGVETVQQRDGLAGVAAETHPQGRKEGGRGWWMLAGQICSVSC